MGFSFFSYSSCYVAVVSYLACEMCFSFWHNVFYDLKVKNDVQFYGRFFKNMLEGSGMSKCTYWNILSNAKLI